MRRTGIAAALVTLTTLAACRTDRGTAPMNRDFTLRQGQLLDVDDSDVRIRLLGVHNDSRCATDIVCVWSGNAEVELEVRAHMETDTLMLNTHVGTKEGIVGGYKIQLIDLQPAPQSNRPIEQDEYRVTLRVTLVPVWCTMEERPSFILTVVDAQDATKSTFRNVWVRVTSGAFRDSVFVPEFNAAYPVAPVHERAGRFTIAVRADGYQPWTSDDVVVERDKCHVHTVHVTARLVK